VKFWLSSGVAPVDELVRFAQDAEAMGYEGVVLPEHLVIKVGERTPHPTGYPIEPDAFFPDPFCVYSAMAAVTTRLRFMTYVFVVPLRNPFALAKQIATLALLSNNRFVLGTGVGWLPEEFDTVGQDFPGRGRRMDEMLEIMRDFWDDGYAEYHGEFYDFPRSGMFPVPSQPVPIWIGGHSGPAAKRAAHFDGYMPMDGLNDRSRGEFRAIDAYRAEHGLRGPYDRVIVAPLEPDPGEMRRIEAEDGITGVVVPPWMVWGESDANHTYDHRRDLVERYAERVMGKM
jgi:probable F420-dependent oxidoreductase